MNSVEISGNDVPILQSDELPAEFTSERLRDVLSILLSRDISEKIAKSIYGENHEIKLENGYSLTYLGAGEFSIVYKLNLNNQEFVIKFRNSETQTKYVNYMQEMLRMNQLKEELGSFLEKYGIKIPNYYFSTVNLCCRESVDGSILDLKSANEVVPLIENAMTDFLSRKKLENPGLWSNCALDLKDKGGNYSGKSFLKNKQGNIYLLDPFTN